MVEGLGTSLMWYVRLCRLPKGGLIPRGVDEGGMWGDGGEKRRGRGELRLVYKTKKSFDNKQIYVQKNIKLNAKVSEIFCMNKSFSDCSRGKYASFTIYHLKPAEVMSTAHYSLS